LLLNTFAASLDRTLPRTSANHALDIRFAK
jgi:hypothetical protein